MRSFESFSYSPFLLNHLLITNNCQLIFKSIGILHNLALNSKLKYFGKQKCGSAFWGKARQEKLSFDALDAKMIC